MKTERQDKILEILKERKFATVSYLSEHLYSSAPTIRRDLKELFEKGFIQRSHGGAILSDNENSPIPLDFRNQKQISEKIGICNKAASLIKESSVIFIDCSTTTFHLADHIPQNKNITVVTNSYVLCSKLNEKNITTYCTGGILIPQSKAFAGKRAEMCVGDFCADIIFFSSHALDEYGRITDYSDIETNLRKTMLENARI